MKKRSLCISGGGSRGSFAGGLANKLYDSGYRWENFYGTSTGSLLNTLLPIYDFDTLKNIYTNVTDDDIFDTTPFNKKGNVKILRSLYNVARGKKSIGSANKLLKLLENSYTIDIHNNIIHENKIICACVTNFTKGEVEYAYNNEKIYDDFLQYTFASASVPLAMNLVKIGENEYLDGGVMEHIPLQKAIDDGADEIDVIILRHNYSEITEKWASDNLLSVAMRSIDLMMKEISEDDIIIGKLKNTLNKDVTINLFFVPTDLDGNSLIFDPVLMKEWWVSGYNTDVPIYNDETVKSCGLNINIYKLKK